MVILKDIDKPRRDSVKKLGVAAGAAWVAPAVTSLVVPRHASATSSVIDTFTPNGIEIQTFEVSNTSLTFEVKSTELDLTGYTLTVNDTSVGVLSAGLPETYSFSAFSDYSGLYAAFPNYTVILSKDDASFTKSATATEPRRRF